MTHQKEYFALELDFAKRVSEIKNEKLEDVLINFTTLYKHFNIPDWDFDSKNPVWQDFIQKFHDAEDKTEAVYSFYLDRLKEEKDGPHFGCFSYEYEAKENYIQVHFKNREEAEIGPLVAQKIDARKKELRDMFTEIKSKYPNVVSVVGFSWLYNLEAYKRLFPPEYTQNPKVVSGWFKTSALWGQFIDHKKHLKPDLAEEFRNCIKTKGTIEELEECFPFRLLEPETDIKNFYNFYGI